MPDDDTETEEQSWERKLLARKKFTSEVDPLPLQAKRPQKQRPVTTKSPYSKQKY